MTDFRKFPNLSAEKFGGRWQVSAHAWCENHTVTMQQILVTALGKRMLGEERNRAAKIFAPSTMIKLPLSGEGRRGEALSLAHGPVDEDGRQA